MSDKHRKLALRAAKLLGDAADALADFKRECLPPGDKDDSVYVLKMDMLEYAGFLERKYGAKS